MSQNGNNESKALKRPDQLKPPLRRLVVMFDGTGNTRQSMTNVSRMFEAIDDSLPEFYKPAEGYKDCPTFQGPAYTKTFQCKTCYQSMMDPEHKLDDSEAIFHAGVPCGSCYQLVVEPELQPVQLVKYITGVGTGWKGVIARLTAQTLGYGLSDKIKEGYMWLCDTYQKGDEVFVFGFSRGAFAARSLVSLLCSCCGILPKSGKDKEAINQAFNYYQNVYYRPPDPAYMKSAGEDEVKQRERKRDHFIDHLLKNNVKTQPLHVQVKMLGVWDTVGALGIPVNTGWSRLDDFYFNRGHFKFHNQPLSWIVDNAYHALALDEHREAFNPTLWTTQDPKNQEVKQVWFVGSHCNVGGGADLDDNVDPDDLWQYSYVWMQRHAEKHGLRFFWSYDSPATRQAKSGKPGYLRTRRVSLRRTEPSLDNFVHGIYKCWKLILFARPFIRETNPELAMLHWSALERIKVTHDDVTAAETNHLPKHMTDVYRPKTLCGKKEDNTAIIVPEGSPKVVALYRVDAKGNVLPANWQIETDNVWHCTQWKLPDL